MRSSQGVDPSSQPESTHQAEKALDSKHKQQQQTVDWEDLKRNVKGTLTFLDSESSWKAFKLFNSASRPISGTSALQEGYPRQAVLCPKSSNDVLAAMNFAHRSGIDISVKSGGYNPSSWSTRGTLILDLKELKSVIVHPKSSSSSSSSTNINGGMHVEPTVHERPREELTLSGVNITNNERASTPANSNSQKRKHSPSPTNSSSGNDSIMPPATSDTATRSTNSRQSSSSTSNSSGSATPPIQTMLAQQAQDNANNAAAGQGHILADKGKRRMLDSDRDEQSASQQRQHYIHANAYPPFNLVNADPEQERAFHQRRQSQDGSVSSISNGNDTASNNGQPQPAGDDERPYSATIPFIYDPIRKETVFPGNAPPGTVPFSDRPARGSESSNSNRANGGEMHVASTTSAASNPNAPWPSISSGLPLHSGGSSSANHASSSSSTSQGALNGDGISRPPASRTASSSPAENTFGAAHPSDYNLVSFGTGTTAQHLDSVSSTSAYARASQREGEVEPNEIARNDSGTECFVPWACYPVGSAIFLTGGYGFVSRLYGLSMDLVTQLEIVLPPTSEKTSSRAQNAAGPPPLIDGELKETGRIVTLKVDFENDPELTQEEKQEQRELWWACRGAGTAFGIVTNITSKAYNIGQVLAGNVIFPFNPITTPSLLKHWRDCLKIAPRELYTNFTLTAGPNERGHVVVIQFSWCGRKIAEGEAILQTMLSWDGERCLLKDVEVRPYKHQQENVSQILASKDDTRWLVRSTLLTSLSDLSIHKTVDVFRACRPGTSWLFETAGAAIAEPQYPSCFPMSHRKAPFQVAALHQWTDPKDDELQRKTAEGWIYDVLKVEACGPFPCFLSSGEMKGRARTVYGEENFEKLKVLKKKYDPHCLLKHTHFEDTLNE